MDLAAVTHAHNSHRLMKSLAESGILEILAFISFFTRPFKGLSAKGPLWIYRLGHGLISAGGRADTLASTADVTIIIALKGAIRDFLKSPHCAARCLQHVRSSGQGSIVYKSRATHRALYHVQHAVCLVVQRDSSANIFLTELKSHLLQLSFNG